MATVTLPPIAVATAEVPVWLSRWFEQLQPEPLAAAVADPAKACLFSTDMTIGFCRTGNLASPRIDALTGPVVDLFQRAYDLGVRRFVLTQDTHDPNTPEFKVWPPHCIRGTAESETIPELAALPFARQITVFEKNSLTPGFGTGFDAWLDANRDLTTAIVVGDCTDLCVYQLAMYLRLRANAFNLVPFEVIVPANAVDTYDLPEEAARLVGAFPHPGDFFHQLFLYHMALNGIRVVGALT